MGTLYIVTIPASNPEDLTLRAQRVLGEVALVVSSDPGLPGLPARHSVAAPHVIPSDSTQPATAGHILAVLEVADVAILCPDTSICVSSLTQEVIIAALEREHPVVPVPGTILPFTALVMSGLPADSFLYLGRLPHHAAARRNLLASIAAEHRTLLLLAARQQVQALLSEVHDILGDRPMAVAPSDPSPVTVWRGSSAEAWDSLSGQLAEAQLVLIIGGARGTSAPWDEERLQAKLLAYLDQGLGAKEASRQLAAESGWPRRDIYRMAVGSQESTDSPTKGARPNAGSS